MHLIWKTIVFFFSRNTVLEDTQRAAATLLVEEEYRSLVDFDNHLDDVSKDWRNLHLNDIISRCT